LFTADGVLLLLLDEAVSRQRSGKDETQRREVAKIRQEKIGALWDQPNKKRGRLGGLVSDNVSHFWELGVGD